MDIYSFTDIKIYKVSELNFEIRNEIESVYPDIWVEGEISNFAYPNKKHMYFSLVDENSMIKVAMFESNSKNIAFDIGNGLHVYINGYVSTYDKRSEYQIIAYNIIPVKKGDLLIAFEQLKKKLRDMGLFDEEIKRAIPILPEKIGVITSKSGAVIRDIIKILNKRFGNYHLIIRNTSVQGNGAAKEIIKAIDDFEEYNVDVIIIARGGGSFEDLAAFNDEELALRIYKCNIPIISGVGHQTDFTICDFVSDKRAATPTHAAELVILNKVDEMSKICKNKEKFLNIISQKLNFYKKELKSLEERKVFKQPNSLLNSLWQLFDGLNDDLRNSYINLIKLNKNKYFLLNTSINLKIIKDKINKNKIVLNHVILFLKNNLDLIINSKKNSLDIILERLDSYNPASILKRGFSIVKNKENGKIVKSINDTDVNSHLLILLYDGFIESIITAKGSDVSGNK
jgi:exodeoxyribonuclease VII large subunit